MSVNRIIYLILAIAGLVMTWYYNLQFMAESGGSFDISEFIAAGLEEYLYSGGVAVMEWADRWPEILPKETLKVTFSIIDNQRREITLSGENARADEIIGSLRQKMKRG